MVVGTASHVGKSVVTTALCRILRQDGYRVAPFKSQNMALNSAVCFDGSEIGRAQVAQAEAAGVAPEADMNPILLKPSGHNSMQVVLHGHVYGTMTGAEYYEQKPFFLKEALASFHRLAAKFDVIVLEGAGSAAEVNLKSRDIVNLPFALAVGSKALLVADIDRGGVFASIAGTFALLDDDERAVLRAFIINRFRGDLRLFDGGPKFLEQRTGRPCFGVLPYMESLRIDQEDSVSLEERRSADGAFRVGVIRLPHISNYTDFNPLECLPGVSVEYLQEPDERMVDLLIIPGTKNTIADLQWLMSQGFRAVLAATLERGGTVLGICGGYQMLGHTISDPHGVEAGGAVEGLDLLPVETELERSKITVQSEGRSFIGPAVRGYEIHVGRTRHMKPVTAFLTKSDGTADGAVAGRVAGTYFHGVFENADFTQVFLSRVAESRRLEWRPQRNNYSKEAEYDRLAETARRHLNTAGIRDLIDNQS
ncbi:MAG: cobyric acid synthase CobQ [Acidobacteria bacterium]|nr:MAG: cobyric acid synthase CobQ [Acidobacteriota bacterium]